MPDLDSAIIFNNTELEIIRLKESDPNFCYENWGDSDLEPLRISIRNFYRSQQKGKCAYCKGNISLVSALNCHVEHIVPKSLHFDYVFIPKNLCVICADCNQIKRDQEILGEIEDTITNPLTRKLYPRSSKAFKIVHPHFDNYNDHIVIINGYYLDKTIKGHFTIGACKLNRKLHTFGWEKKITEDAEISDLMNAYLSQSDSIKRAELLRQFKAMLFY